MKRNDVLKCAVCGMIVEILDAGSGSPPVCCDEPMTILPEQTAEFKLEKHVPYPQGLPDGRIRVTVGKEALHPMTEAHRIEWIEISDDKETIRRYLAPGDTPEATFAIPFGGKLVIREFCNLHGLWVYEMK